MINRQEHRDRLEDFQTQRLSVERADRRRQRRRDRREKQRAEIVARKVHGFCREAIDGGSRAWQLWLYVNAFRVVGYIVLASLLVLIAQMVATGAGLVLGRVWAENIRLGWTVVLAFFVVAALFAVGMPVYKVTYWASSRNVRRFSRCLADLDMRTHVFLARRAKRQESVSSAISAVQVVMNREQARLQELADRERREDDAIEKKAVKRAVRLAKEIEIERRAQEIIERKDKSGRGD